MRRNSIRVLNVLPLGPDAEARLEAISDELQISYRDAAPSDWVINQLEDPLLEVLLSSHPPSDLTRTPRLRWLQTGSTGVEHLKARLLADANVVVTNASGVHAVPIAEYTFGALFHIVKKVEDRQASQRRREWPSGSELSGDLLRGKSLLVVGYGSVGREIARLAKAFGMRVLATKANPLDTDHTGYRVPGTGDPNGTIPQRIGSPRELVALIAQADFVVVTLPSTPETRGVINEEALSAMRKQAWLINVGRGACVDSGALESALRDQRIGGAVLDVFESEPLPTDSALWGIPRCIVTPHIAGSPVGTSELLVDLVVQNLTRYVNGRSLLNVVDLNRGY